MFLLSLYPELRNTHPAIEKSFIVHTELKNKSKFNNTFIPYKYDSVLYVEDQMVKDIVQNVNYTDKKIV